METRLNPDPLMQPTNCPKCGLMQDSTGWCKSCAIRSTIQNTILICLMVPLAVSFSGLLFGAALGSCVAGLSNRQAKFTEITDIYFRITPPMLAILLGILGGLIYLLTCLAHIRKRSKADP